MEIAAAMDGGQGATEVTADDGGFIRAERPLSGDDRLQRPAETSSIQMPARSSNTSAPCTVTMFRVMDLGEQPALGNHRGGQASTESSARSSFSATSRSSRGSQAR